MEISRGRASALGADARRHERHRREPLGYLPFFVYRVLIAAGLKTPDQVRLKLKDKTFDLHRLHNCGPIAISIIEKEFGAAAAD